VGLLAALELYPLRDFEAERQQWMNDLECVISGVRDAPGVNALIVYPQPNGRETPTAQISLDPAVLGIDAATAINLLQEGDPPICVFEKLSRAGKIVIMPEGLRPGEAAIVNHRLREILRCAI
jgi:hypothetical protein